MRYDALFFDAAETLFTTRGSVGEIYGAVSRDYGSTATPQEIHSAFVRQFHHSGPLTLDDEKRWWRDVVFRVFAEVGMVRDFEEFFDTVYDQFRDSRGWLLFPETKEVLAKARGLGLRMGVISNFDSRIYGLMRNLEILSFFDSITISSETGYAKPHPGIFQAAVRAAGVPASRALFVGDSLADDVEAGNSAGLDTVLLDRTGLHTGLNAFPRIQNLRHVLPML